MATKSMKEFAEWVKKNDPKVYALAAKRHAIKTGGKEVYGLSGYQGDLAGLDDFFSTLSETVSKILPSVIQYKTQTKILDTQLKRGQQGLPPLNVEDYSPVLRVSPSFDQSSEAALTRMAVKTTGSSLNKLMPVIIAGVVGFFALALFRGGRGRG